MLCSPEGSAAADPDPAETAKRNVELVDAWDGWPAGIVGWREGGWSAAQLAAAHPELVDRLVLVSTPIAEDEASLPLAAISAKSLLLYGSKDPAGGHRQATRWKDGLGGRIEIVPGGGSDILERVWSRVLSHLAPGALRK